MLSLFNKGFKLLVLSIAALNLGYAKANIESISVSCVYNSTNDQSLCIQKFIDISAREQKLLYFKRGTLFISKPIVLRNNTNIVGNQTIFKLNFSKPYQSAFLGKDLSNISINGIIISSQGVFLSKEFISKYNGSGYAVGYTNQDKGISIYGRSSNISLKNMEISGVEKAIDIDNGDISSKRLVQNVVITNNQITNVGQSAIRIVNANWVTISNNTITGVLGNMDNSAGLKLANAKFADGIYLSGVTNASIGDNYISNVARIGIALEGAVVNHKIINTNDNIKIIGNIIYNVNNCRGTENNAAIWVEPSATETNKLSYKTGTVVIEKNLIDNSMNTSSCSHNQYGLFLGAKNNIVRNNKILNFTALRNYAINCNYGTIELRNNEFKNNRKDIFINNKAYYLKIQ